MTSKRPTITKADIADAIRAELPELTVRGAIDLVATVFETIKDTLEAGEPVLVTAFGKWEVREKAERVGRNPETREELLISARRVVTFKPGGRLREAMNGVREKARGTPRTGSSSAARSRPPNQRGSATDCRAARRSAGWVVGIALRTFVPGPTSPIHAGALGREVPAVVALAARVSSLAVLVGLVDALGGATALLDNAVSVIVAGDDLTVLNHFREQGRESPGVDSCVVSNLSFRLRFAEGLHRCNNSIPVLFGLFPLLSFSLLLFPVLFGFDGTDAGLCCPLDADRPEPPFL